MTDDTTKPAASTASGDPFLLTPGPLTTSLTVKQAMLHDYGSRDATFIDLNARILERLVDIVHGQGTHVSVPLQGSGTFVVEAMIGNFVPADGKLLVLINGAYGKRIAKICDYYKRDYEVQESPEDVPVDTAELDATLDANPDISHVVVVHCETTSGILNPIRQVSEIVARHQRSLLIDSMSAFGALPLDAREIEFDAVVASSNKCLEGAPGMGFCVARESALEKTEGNSPSLVLDLYDQWRAMQKNRQWRFTPPTHVLLAFDQALNEYEAEGGVAGRGGRYRENCDLLVSSMRDMGFKTLLPDELQAPIIITFHMPTNPEFDFNAFYDGLKDQGYVIYPGKLTVADSFRMGCIGRLGTKEIRGALKAVAGMLQQFGIERISNST
ncbi:MAG: 2-aminoethylphosphonate--pyruvate transaminase [Gammaproteobacteria bacterium]|nr:2-aminoethylphosphonate--pyruvate transaminase [Gammaproteobacteria bacterium]MDH3856993.1 2-aminoethylphosphonate--pyruvate transaminase [Gammaproteobacteria bacterium]